jgi:hypothetical protein
MSQLLDADETSADERKTFAKRGLTHRERCAILRLANADAGHKRIAGGTEDAVSTRKSTANQGLDKPPELCNTTTADGTERNVINTANARFVRSGSPSGETDDAITHLDN